MKLRDLLGTAFGNLTRHKARTALTTVGVIVGILTIVTMVSLGIGVQREMHGAFGSVGLESLRLHPVTEEAGGFDLFGQPERTLLLTDELLHTLSAREGVLEAIPYLQLPYGLQLVVELGEAQADANPWGPRPAMIPEPFGLPSQTLAGLDDPPQEGGAVVVSDSLLQQLEVDEDQPTSLVGEELAVVLYAPRGESQRYVFSIAGVVERRQSSVELALPDRRSILEWWYNDPDYVGNRGYDEIFVRARSLNDAAQTVDWLSSLGYEVESLKTMLDMANRGMIIVQTMLASVGALALLVASIGIANTMIMAVYERTKEIGILKAVGAAPSQIRWLFVVEASLIGLLGGVLGTVLGWLLGKLLNWLILEILRWQDIPMQGTFFVVSWWLVLAALLFAALVGLLAGLYPAARAARLAPLDALRYD
jgi:ABC-type lipoprotein release transport system permease subunit